MKYKVAIPMLLLSLCAAASANPVTIQFNHATNATYDGVQTYPYSGTLDGVPDTFMCVTFDKHITKGESWLANAIPIDVFGAPYREAAWLFTQAETAPASQVPFIQGAAWTLFSAHVKQTTGELYWLNLAETFHGGDSFPNIDLYVPVNGKSNGPQWFLGNVAQTPEPSSLSLIGSGLLGIAGLIRKRRLSCAN